MSIGNNYSSHVFLFPFVWDAFDKTGSGKPKKADDPFKSIKGVLDAPNSNWKSVYNDKVSLKSDFNDEEKRLFFNEHQYFFPFVKDTLYSYKTDNDICQNYVRKSVVGSEKYVIEKDEKVYSLNIDSIGLSVFSTGIAVLYYKLKYEVEDGGAIPLQDILNINEYGRRLYYSFIPSNKVTQCYFNADKISIAGLDGESDIVEAFEPQIKDYANNFDYLSNTVLGVLGDEFFCSGKNAQSYDITDNRRINIIPVIDDRMFVMCYYKNSAFSNAVTAYDEKSRNYAYEKVAENPIDYIDNLYKYIFIDNSFPSCQNIGMKAEQLKKHIYERWTDYGTIYAGSEYSFVVLVNEEAPEFFRDHFNTLYFNMVLLCLAQRGSLIEFSNRSSNLSRGNVKKSIFKEISSLQEKYIQFINQVNHENVTAQQQGIEIYGFIKENLLIQKNISDVENKLNNLYNLSNFKQQQNINYLLIFIAALGVVIGGLEILAIDCLLFKIIATSVLALSLPVVYLIFYIVPRRRSFRR
jgi:hypothetical protein